MWSRWWGKKNYLNLKSDSNEWSKLYMRIKYRKQMLKCTSVSKWIHDKQILQLLWPFFNELTALKKLSVGKLNLVLRASDIMWGRLPQVGEAARVSLAFFFSAWALWSHAALCSWGAIHHIWNEYELLFNLSRFLTRVKVLYSCSSTFCSLVELNLARLKWHPLV